MNPTREQWKKIIGIVINAVLAIAAVLGWVFPVQSPNSPFATQAVRERIAFDAMSDSYLHSGADLYVYSDRHATQKLHIDGATGDIDTEGDVVVAADVTIGDGTASLTQDGEDLYVEGTLEADGAARFDGAIDANSTANIQGVLTLQAGLTTSDGDVVVADDVRVTAQTAITVTNGAAFTATGTYQAIQAAGEVTPTITVGTAGDLLVLINTSDQTINIADTGIQKLTAALAMGQYDVLVLWCDGTNWIEISRANN